MFHLVRRALLPGGAALSALTIAAVCALWSISLAPRYGVARFENVSSLFDQRTGGHAAALLLESSGGAIIIWGSWERLIPVSEMSSRLAASTRPSAEDRQIVNDYVRVFNGPRSGNQWQMGDLQPAGTPDWRFGGFNLRSYSRTYVAGLITRHLILIIPDWFVIAAALTIWVLCLRRMHLGALWRRMLQRGRLRRVFIWGLSAALGALACGAICLSDWDEGPLVVRGLAGWILGTALAVIAAGVVLRLWPGEEPAHGFEIVMESRRPDEKPTPAP